MPTARYFVGRRQIANEAHQKKVVEAHAIENAHAQKAGKPLPSLAP